MPLAYIDHGAPTGANLEPIGDPVMSESEEGWDSLTQSYLMESNPLQLGTHLEERLPRGGAHPYYPSMRITKRTSSDLGGRLYQVDLTYRGIVNTRGYRRDVKCYGETSTGERILISPEIQALGYPAFAQKMKIVQPLLSVTTSYVSLTTPTYTELKKAVDTLPSGFPALPTPPSQIWSFITDPTYVYPSGWILDDRDAKPLPWTTLHLVADRHVFRFSTEM